MKSKFRFAYSVEGVLSTVALKMSVNADNYAEGKKLAMSMILNKWKDKNENQITIHN